MRLSELIRTVEDKLVAASKMVIADSKAVVKAIKDNHTKQEEVKQ